MSVYSMVISAGMVIGTPSSSVVLDAGGRPAMLGFFGLCAGLMLLFVVIRRFDLRRHPGDDNINDEEEPGTDN
jgi:predicted MFS family arabinose efflux permease